MPSSVNLEMPHIAAIGEMQEQIEAKTEPVKSAVNPKNPKLEKNYTFDFKYVDGRGKEWSGKFKNHILSIKENQTCGLMQAQLQQGMAYESIDPLTKELNYILAHLSVSLDKELRPDWAIDLQNLTDIRLLQALYAEVNNHEITFLGL